MRHQTLRTIQRYLAVISFISVIGMAMVTLRLFGYDLPNLLQLVPAGTFGPFFNREIALVSGHAGYDSGAICVDANGVTTVTEAAINAAITQRVAQRLRRNGALVTVLDEFDERLPDLQADLLLSFHSDSCIEASGYKTAYATNAAVVVATTKLSNCFDRHYAPMTELAWHPDTITHDMTDYHVFREVASTTPALILEMGFIGGDQQLLLQHPNTVAAGITESIRCFFEKETEVETE
ncbi:MAG: N-acetylmuramoyl-L-alanine amidase [Caldilineaceae bacterium]|nr:N-acetylmuramoyl-L-alanine amidase [Caldilineaceae bacterium]